MAGIRDRLIHDYENVSLEIVWKTMSEDLPKLVAQLKLVLCQTNLFGLGASQVVIC
jgi:uncharacterized protein with HEPN domain